MSTALQYQPDTVPSGPMDARKSPEYTCAMCSRTVSQAEVWGHRTNPAEGTTRALCVSCFATATPSGPAGLPHRPEARVSRLSSLLLRPADRLRKATPDSEECPASSPTLQPFEGVAPPPHRGAAFAFPFPSVSHSHVHPPSHPHSRTRAAADTRVERASLTEAPAPHSPSATAPASVSGVSELPAPGSRNTRCDWRQRCKFGLRCMFLHSPLEKQYFQTHPNGNPVWKTETCVNWKPHSHLECDFYHPGEDDPWCERVGPNLRSNAGDPRGCSSRPERRHSGAERRSSDRRRDERRREQSPPHFTRSRSERDTAEAAAAAPGVRWARAPPSFSGTGRSRGFQLRRTAITAGGDRGKRCPPGFERKARTSPPREPRVGDATVDDGKGRADRAMCWRGHAA